MGSQAKNLINAWAIHAPPLFLLSLSCAPCIFYIYTDSSCVADTNGRVSTKAYDNPVYNSSCDKSDETDKPSISDPERQFDNPIYGTKDTENAYSMITDDNA